AQRASHRSGAGHRGPRERRCRGARGAKPLGVKKPLGVNMKAKERHKLKENDFARTVASASGYMQTRGQDAAKIVSVIVVAILLAGGYAWWRQSRNGKANTLLASALNVEEAPVIAPSAPAPGSPIPVQQPGTYPTEQAKLEAALPALMKAADA